MGLEIIHVLSDESHYGPFECAICQNLVGLDAVVTTPCSHVFCRLCLEKWLDRPREPPVDSGPGQYFFPVEYRCPTCNQDLDYQSRNKQQSSKETIMIGGISIEARPLEEAQPLAYRVLRRIQIACPLLAKHGCIWKGDYEDLTEHLLSETAHHAKNTNTVVSESSSVEGNATGDDFDKNSDMDCEDCCKSSPPPVKRSKSNEQLKRFKTFEKNQERDTKIDERHDLAESFKIQANAKFSSANFKEARDLYTKAISVLQAKNSGESQSHSMNRQSVYSEKDKDILATLFANRAACHLQMKQYHLCIDDCKTCVNIDQHYVKAYLRLSKAQIEVGNFSEAFQTLHTAYHTHNSTSNLLQNQLSHVQYIHTQFQLGKSQYQNGQYASASATFGSLLRKTNSAKVILAGARSELKLGLVDQAMRLSLQVIRSDTQNAEGYEIRGYGVYLTGEDSEGGCKLLREALRLDPDNKEAKLILKQCRKVSKYLKEARNAVFHRQFEKAVELFTNALDESDPLPVKTPLYSILHAERGQAHLRLKNYTTALQDSNNAIYSREDHVVAWLVKVNAYHGLGRHEDAKQELDDLMQKWGSGNDKIRKASEHADFLVRRMKRTDFYALFGVSAIASTMEIKKQYKVKALELHPDRFSGSQYTEEDRKKASEQFKLLGDGLEILCDDFKRKLYDEGYDPKGIRERVAMAEQAAHRQPGRNYHGHHHGH